MEITAEPYNRKVHGLWRRPRKADGSPGSMTQFIIYNRLDFVLPDDLPLNPACLKGRQGWIFRPPYDARAWPGCLRHWLAGRLSRRFDFFSSDYNGFRGGANFYNFKWLCFIGRCTADPMAIIFMITAICTSCYRKTRIIVTYCINREYL